MKISRSNRFKKQFNRLPLALQLKVKKQTEFLLQDFWYPSLHTEKLEGQFFMGYDVWSIRVDLEYRIHFVILKEKDTYFFIEISKHYQ